MKTHFERTETEGPRVRASVTDPLASPQLLVTDATSTISRVHAAVTDVTVLYPQMLAQATAPGTRFLHQQKQQRKTHTPGETNLNKVQKELQTKLNKVQKRLKTNLNKL